MFEGKFGADLIEISQMIKSLIMKQKWLFQKQ